MYMLKCPIKLNILVRKQEMKKQLNPWLDICRATAILLVLLSHGRIFITPIFPNAQTLKFGGFLGVEFFFVLSGFLIGGIILDKIKTSKSPWSWVPGFWGRRWMRTYPSYFLFVIINILIISSIRQEPFPNLLKFLTFTQSLLSPHPSFFGEAWSLAIEEVFYFITPIVLSVFMSITNNKRISILLTVLLLIIIPVTLRIHASLYTIMTFNEIRSTALYRIDSIMIGVIAVVFYNKFGSNTLVKIGTLLIPLCIYIASKPDSFMDESTILKIILFPLANAGFACLICAGYRVRVSPIINHPFSKIARWSYAAYLTNLPVLVSIRYFSPPPTTLSECLMQWFLFISITLISAWLVYSFFEKSVLSMRDKIISS
ncbi:O-acetyltransferase OatA [Serratia quinivorans]|nr:O-acetyltransferase OatA [Serratia quinivorans]CAI1521994.1 O-acetyltransferase OatA [Serratia quinivorans]